MPRTVDPTHYLGDIGWKSCIDRHDFRSRHLSDARWGYWILLKDVAEINVLEKQYVEDHGRLPPELRNDWDRKR